MEIANLDRVTIRMGVGKDAPYILQLINEATYSHIHADWHAPGDWLDTPGFVISEGQTPSKSLVHFGRSGPEILGCLAVAADPVPSAWVRLAAVRRPALAEETLASMLEAVVPNLKEAGVNELGWLAIEAWPDKILPSLGFERANWIITFVKDGLDVPCLHKSEVQIRPVKEIDMARLAAIEVNAFDPLWRHSAEGLKIAEGYSICFDIAELAGEIVGFQYSTSNYNGAGAHLVRISVDPAFQGLGVGSALLMNAFEQYRKCGIDRVSLNTQLDNIASHRLYEKFGFKRTGDQMPVWVLKLDKDLA